VDGVLRIRIARQDGETRVVESYARAPFHYLPPIPRDGSPPLLTIVNSSGGILGGDVLDARIELEAQAALTLRQQAATKAYRSANGPARSRCDFVLGEAAVLDYFPDEIIPFAGSEYAQTTRVELERDALMLLGEIVTAGRQAQGEQFAFTRLTLDVQCAAGDTLLLRDRADIEPARQRLHSPGVLGDATVWGAFYLLTTAAVEGSLIEGIDEILHAVVDGTGGATAAPSGIVGRVVGTSLETVRDALQAARTRVLDRLNVGGAQ
jgi:urease accessory protein